MEANNNNPLADQGLAPGDAGNPTYPVAVTQWSQAPVGAPVPIQAPSSAPAFALPGSQGPNMPVPNGNERLPRSPYEALQDYIRERGIVDEADLMFTLGVQHGIGLGIHNTREAILNEMTFEGTCFGRSFALKEDDKDRFHMRYSISNACAKGFDLRVALRTADRYVDYMDAQQAANVTNGLAVTVPRNGPHLLGPSGTINENQGRAAFWYPTSRIMPNPPEATGIEELPYPQANNGPFNPAPGNTAALDASSPFPPLSAPFHASYPVQSPTPFAAQPLTPFHSQSPAPLAAPYMAGNQTIPGGGMANLNGAPGFVGGLHTTAFGNPGMPSGQNGQGSAAPPAFPPAASNQLPGAFNVMNNTNEDVEMGYTDEDPTTQAQTTFKDMSAKHRGSGRRRGSGTKRSTNTRPTGNNTSGEDDSDSDYVEKSSKSSSVTVAGRKTRSTRTRTGRKRLTVSLPSEDDTDADADDY